MITREDFISKLNTFNYDNEQIIKCLEYYDNSKSKKKKDIIENYDSKRLIGVVNRWYGIVYSTKRKNIKRPIQLSQNLSDILEKLGKYKQPFYDLLMMVNNETDYNSLKLLINQRVNLENILTNRRKSVPILHALMDELNSFCCNKSIRLSDPTFDEKRKIRKLINELNEKDPTSKYIYSLEMKEKTDTKP